MEFQHQEEAEEGKSKREKSKHDAKIKRATKGQGPQDDAKIYKHYDPIHSMNQIIN
jgi:hypothetical protein